MDLLNRNKTKLINGKTIANEINAETAKLVSKMHPRPKLAIILASDDESSKVYVELKQKKAKELGIDSDLFHFSELHPKDQIINEIKRFRYNEAISGVLLQLPFYDHLKKSTKELVNALTPEKDVDGLTAIQQGNASHFIEHSILPATVEAVLECFNAITEEDLSWANLVKDHSPINFFKGKNILMVNNTNLIGKPLAALLTSLDATVIIANDTTKNLVELSKMADIIVSATGKGNLIDADMIKDGVVLIDVTSLKVGDKIIGDFVLSDELINKCSFITPVPGGVGPLTVACLLRNLVR